MGEGGGNVSVQEAEQEGVYCTWCASAGLSYAELLMRGATITTGLPGEDGGLCQSLRWRGGQRGGCR